jgi:hypothetical protein
VLLRGFIALSIRTFSIKGLVTKLSIYMIQHNYIQHSDTQNNNTQGNVSLNVAFSMCCILLFCECRYNECCCTKYCYSECMQGECHYAECQNTECYGLTDEMPLGTRLLRLVSNIRLGRKGSQWTNALAYFGIAFYNIGSWLGWIEQNVITEIRRKAG